MPAKTQARSASLASRRARTPKRPDQSKAPGPDTRRRRTAGPAPDRLPYGNVGPGRLVEKVRRTRPESPLLEVPTVAYHMSASHDLLVLHGLFGLTTAQDTSRGDFPGVGDFPLAIGPARAEHYGEVRRAGFRGRRGDCVQCSSRGLPDLPTRIRAAFDQPFGFLALHRHTRLVLTAGWVTDPLLLPEYGWEFREPPGLLRCRTEAGGRSGPAPTPRPSSPVTWSSSAPVSPSARPAGQQWRICCCHTLGLPVLRYQSLT